MDVSVNAVVVPSPVFESREDWPNVTPPNSSAFPAAFTCTTLPPWPLNVLGVTSVSPRKLVDIEVNDRLPEPSVWITWLAVPSVVGNTKVLVLPESVFTSSPCLTRNFLLVAMFPLFHYPQWIVTFIYIFLTLDIHNVKAFVQLNTLNL